MFAEQSRRSRLSWVGEAVFVLVAAVGCEANNGPTAVPASPPTVAIPAPAATPPGAVPAAVSAPPVDAATPSSAPAPTTTSAPAGVPVAKVVGNVAQHDLGPVRPATVHLMTFAIDNPGERPVAIRQIVPDCNCITAVDPPKELAAGKTTNVAARFVVPNYAGPYLSQLTVMTTDPNRKLVYLRVVCEVVK